MATKLLKEKLLILQRFGFEKNQFARQKSFNPRGFPFQWHRDGEKKNFQKCEFFVWAFCENVIDEI